MLPPHVNVLIVGAGPVGLTSAVGILNNLSESQRSSFSILLIDRVGSFDNVSQDESRALAVHARTMEIVSEVLDDPACREQNEQLPVRDRASAPLVQDPRHIPDKVKNLSQAMLERGLLVSTACIRLTGREDPLMRANLSILGDTQFPHIMTLQQRVTEGLLRARLADLGGAIECGWTLKQLNKPSSPGGPVTLDFEHEKLGERSTVQADFVVGADGGHSTVRQLAGLAWPRQSYPRPLILGEVRVADARWPWAYRESGFTGIEVVNIYSDKGFMLMVPVAGGLLRLAANFWPPGFTPKTPRRSEGGGHVEGEPPTIADWQWMLDHYGPPVTKWIEGGDETADRSVKPNTILSSTWCSTFKLHHGIVTSFLEPESESIAVIGDAAHCHSPMGGRGLNTGIQDAATLAQTLVAHYASEPTARLGALRKWADERRAHGLLVLAETKRLTTASCWTNPILVWIRHLLFRVMGCFARSSQGILKNMAGLNTRPPGWSRPGAAGLHAVR